MVINLNKKIKLTFLYTNDIHGNIHSLNAVESIMENAKKENTVVIDAGDTFSHDYKGKLIENCIADIVDIWVPGNHDFISFPKNVFNIINKERPLVLSSNIKDKENKIKDYIIIDIKGYKFLFFGLSSEIISEKFICKDMGIVYADIIGKYNHQVDFVILISHLGINEDIRIARNTDEIDIIFGGHTHTEIKSTFVVNQTIIAQAGGFGKFAGKMELIIKKGKITNFSNKLILSKEYEINANMYKRFEEIRQGKEKHFHLIDNLFYEKYKDNIIIEGFLNELLNNYEADAVLINSSLFKTFFYKGNITSEDLLGFFNYRTKFFIMFLTCEEVEKVIKKSLKEDYLKLHFLEKENLKCNEKLKIIVNDFLAEGGHYGGTLYPELREKNKIEVKTDNLNLVKSVFKKLFLSKKIKQKEILRKKQAIS
ncbi:MAG: metallophosphoesterase [Candidatus Muirbacterium halophilum]|nr:metallophosphoesterase [Candidatus Muirbacterium halophilum]MCK9476268.1 metallophosphoesterase [Candidatus Muirbacterium halophilum]